MAGVLLKSKEKQLDQAMKYIVWSAFFGLGFIFICCNQPTTETNRDSNIFTPDSASIVEIINRDSNEIVSYSTDSSDSKGNTGILILAKLPPAATFETAGKGSSDIDYDDSPEARVRRKAKVMHYLVCVDDGAPIELSQEKSDSITGISLTGKHKITIRNHNDPIASFFFSFSDYDGHPVQLSYDPFYSNWRLTAIK